MGNLPSFLGAYVPEPTAIAIAEGQAQVEESGEDNLGLTEQATKQVTKNASAGKINYTPRDAETLDLIMLYPVEGDASQAYYEVSNSQLAHGLGMTTGAAAARVARLVKMGVVKPWYSVAVETGKVNRRVLEVLTVPPAPWAPKKDS